MRRAFVLCLLSTICGPTAAQTCDERLSFVVNLIDRDLKTGFLSKKVHEEMTRDLEVANTFCRAGDERKAQALITGTQRRHGYPAR